MLLSILDSAVLRARTPCSQARDVRFQGVVKRVAEAQGSHGSDLLKAEPVYIPITRATSWLDNTQKK